MVGDSTRMALSKAEKYERLSKRAGIAGSVCLIIWIVSLFIAAVWLSGEHRTEWLGVVIGLSFIATVACGVTCLAAAILSRFKSKVTVHSFQPLTNSPHELLMHLKLFPTLRR